ncbi:MAG: hypothetical protein JWO45_931 [Spartobacteria bacterium]|nr:hypothetical protein [Spartobacteria bacterium]
MKPTPQDTAQDPSARYDRDPQRSAHAELLTDYSYQTTAQAIETSAAVAEVQSSEVRTFRHISRDFFNGEAHREYIKEAFLFLGISGVAAWPLSVVVHQLTQWVISPPPGGIW